MKVYTYNFGQILPEVRYYSTELARDLEEEEICDGTMSMLREQPGHSGSKIRPI